MQPRSAPVAFIAGNLAEPHLSQGEARSVFGVDTAIAMRDTSRMSHTTKAKRAGRSTPAPVPQRVESYLLGKLCACGCGRKLTGRWGQKTATPACRQRLRRSLVRAAVAERNAARMKATKDRKKKRAGKRVTSTPG
jgi:hypothetical protein